MDVIFLFKFHKKLKVEIGFFKLGMKHIRIVNE